MSDKPKRQKLKTLNTRISRLCACAFGPLRCKKVAVEGSDYCEEHKRQMAKYGILWAVPDGR